MPDKTAVAIDAEEKAAPPTFVESAWADRDGVMRTNLQKREIVAAALERRAMRGEGQP